MKNDDSALVYFKKKIVKDLELELDRERGFADQIRVKKILHELQNS